MDGTRATAGMPSWAKLDHERAEPDRGGRNRTEVPKPGPAMGVLQVEGLHAGMSGHGVGADLADATTGTPRAC